MSDSALGRAQDLLDDPIVTISTPRGRGAIGIVRISGSSAQVEALLRGCVGDTSRLTDRQLALCSVRMGGELVDRGLVVWFRGPRTYTGEDVAELHLHGNPAILERVLQGLIEAGARAAGPGEFTRRAVLRGRLSLLDAEAIDALVRAPGVAAARVAGRQLGGELTGQLEAWREQLLVVAVALEAAVDFPEEVEDSEIRGDLARIGDLRRSMAQLAGTARAGRRLLDGVRVVLTGPVNAGKSTLFNALLGHDRAIVSPRPGTTRDLVSESVEWDGVLYRLEDTAGLRDALDPVEVEGVSRSGRAVEAADVVVQVRDARSIDEELPGLSVATHADLLDDSAIDALSASGWLPVSAPNGSGLDAVRDAVRSAAGVADALSGDLVLHTVRQARALELAVAALDDALRSGAHEIVLSAVAIRRAGRALEELVGAWPEERVLDDLFSRFCIGK